MKAITVTAVDENRVVLDSITIEMPEDIGILEITAKDVFAELIIGKLAMKKSKNQQYVEAYYEGRDAVRMKPHFAPRNPYDESNAEEKDRADGWDAGADSAGINTIYTNGVLNASER